MRMGDRMIMEIRDKEENDREECYTEGNEIGEGDTREG